METTINAQAQTTGCCPRFEPEKWDQKQITFKDKLFVQDNVRSFLHIPLNFGAVVTRNIEKIRQAGALTPDQIMLCDEKSLWGTTLYIEATKDVPGVTMTKISGTFLCRAFEGPYKNIGQWIKEMHSFVESKAMQIKKLYFYYTTCPKCAKVYGKNYIVILAQI
jgi:hypothetical protein